MVDLKAKTACDGLLPLRIGTVDVAELDLGALTSIAPYSGQANALSEALKSAHGMTLPSANRVAGKEGARAIWFGQDLALLAGPIPDKGLAQHAALTEQSDAWAVVQLSGEGAEDVLARLIPVDLRSSVFKRGHTARTAIKHMNGSVSRIGENRFIIMVFRSMAATLVHDLKEAMEAVAART